MKKSERTLHTHFQNSLTQLYKHINLAFFTILLTERL